MNDTTLEPRDRVVIWAKRTGRIPGFAVLFARVLYPLPTCVPR